MERETAIKTESQGLHSRISLNILYGIALFLPLYPVLFGISMAFPPQEIFGIFLLIPGRIIPILIATLLLNWLMDWRNLILVPTLFKEKERIRILGFSLLYLAYITGLLWTTNFGYAALDLEVKLSLLVFPLIFATSPQLTISSVDFSKIIRLFTWGCITVSLILFGHAIYNYAFVHIPDPFYYANLSWHIHPSYLAMYLTFAISNILYYLLIKKSVNGSWKRAGYTLLLMYLVIFTVLLSSKAGLLSMLMVFLFYALILAIRFRQRVSALLFLSFSLTVFFGAMAIFPIASKRIALVGKELSTGPTSGKEGESTSDRLSAWKSAWNIIKDNPLAGVGTGDVKDELFEDYRKSDARHGLKYKLNVHNQYLQTSVAIGDIGLLILISMIALPAWYSLWHQYDLYFVFLLIFGMNILFESMFEIQQGVIFFSYFNMILFRGRRSA
jgi:O-antigen ligase